MDLHPLQFKGVFSLAKKISEEDPERHIFHTVARVGEARQKLIYPKALRLSIQSILDRYNAKSEFISFCSFPVQVNKHWISVVIQIDRDVYRHQYQFSQKVVKLEKSKNFEIGLHTCFLEAIVERIFAVGITEVQSSSKGECWELEKAERVVEDAASRLLDSIQNRVNPLTSKKLLELANAVSAEKYEGSGSKGRLILAAKDNPHILTKIALKEPVYSNDFRGIRKLVEISDEEIALLYDGAEIWGLCCSLNTYNACEEDLFEIRFTDHYTWELTHDNHTILNFRYSVS